MLESGEHQILQVQMRELFTDIKSSNEDKQQNSYTVGEIYCILRMQCHK